jgi:pyruvate carboxylase
MIKDGVPCTPGTEGNVAGYRRALKGDRISYRCQRPPTAAGAAFGAATRARRLEQAFPRVISEATKVAGRASVPKCIVNPKHIRREFLWRQHGNVVHLFERDCSIQRQPETYRNRPQSAADPRTTGLYRRPVVREEAVGYRERGHRGVSAGEDGGCTLWR